MTLLALESTWEKSEVLFLYEKSGKGADKN